MTSLRVLVPGRMAGSIIGKGGTRIKQLKADFESDARIPDR